MKRFSYPAILEAGQRSVWRPATAAVLLIWLFHFLTVNGIGLFYFGDGWQYLDQRVFVMAFGILTSLGLVWVMQATWRWSVMAKIALVTACACLAAAPYATVNWYLMYYIEGDVDNWDIPWWIGWSKGANLFMAQMVATVAVQYAVRLLAREERLHSIERAARSSELKALRYQVNPHFLFNSLNAVAALVEDQRHEEAENMLIDLAHYYRAALTVDPLADVPLGEEVEAQLVYASIEQQRFPDRFVMETDIPPEAARLPVPSLILQPLIENAIKHGVARSRSKVRVRITAVRTADGALLVSVRDRHAGALEPDTRKAKGTGTGLGNVRARLVARYGNASGLETEQHDNGFEVRLRVPVMEMA
ncbi:sensor histidine kinase [Sphingomicrobium aestuariivivum]|uniref:sensor histidine kinase n=1 Tax=Sphingomicrobium aestuariivivum TaxID=1582356 RepID=UPI001FD6CE50|nr:histidine kinase [Sphingomicrobium aestuariivivum]MCJ8190891.1 histidine kinase [Sphingomicrobium aestuariivivum]